MRPLPLPQKHKVQAVCASTAERTQKPFPCPQRGGRVVERDKRPCLVTRLTSVAFGEISVQRNLSRQHHRTGGWKGPRR